MEKTETIIPLRTYFISLKNDLIPQENISRNAGRYGGGTLMHSGSFVSGDSEVLVKIDGVMNSGKYQDFARVSDLVVDGSNPQNTSKSIPKMVD